MAVEWTSLHLSLHNQCIPQSTHPHRSNVLKSLVPTQCLCVLALVIVYLCALCSVRNIRRSIRHHLGRLPEEARDDQHSRVQGSLCCCEMLMWSQWVHSVNIKKSLQTDLHSCQQNITHATEALTAQTEESSVHFVPRQLSKPLVSTTRTMQNTLQEILAIWY